jgi:hypothetical protein
MLAELSIHYRTAHRGPWTIHGTWHMHMGHGMLPSAAPPAPGARRWGGTDVRRAAGGRGVGVHSCPFRGPQQSTAQEQGELVRECLNVCWSWSYYYHPIEIIDHHGSSVLSSYVLYHKKTEL